MLFINKILVSCEGEFVGFILENKNECYAAVTQEKAIELGVQDAEYASLMDFPKETVVLSPSGEYALLDKEDAYFQNMEFMPYEKLGVDQVCIYGHVFHKSCLCPLDNEFAIRRLLQSM